VHIYTIGGLTTGNSGGIGVFSGFECPYKNHYVKLGTAFLHVHASSPKGVASFRGQVRT